jgi:hypothetical protein
MNDELDIIEAAKRNDLIAKFPRRTQKEEESDEERCPAYGYLRGFREQALTLEFRYRDENIDAFPYSHMASWRFNPSIGLLLKFTSDVTTLVLVEGSNLNVELPNRSVNLTDRGIAKHRITYVREMDEDELKRQPKGLPTIDKLIAAEFKCVEAQEEWLRQNAIPFARP